MVGVMMSEENDVDAGDAEGERLRPQVGRGVDQHACRIRELEIDRRPPAPIPRVVRVTGGTVAPDHRDTGRRPGSKKGDTHVPAC